MTPQPARQISGLVRRVSARARACVQTPSRTMRQSPIRSISPGWSYPYHRAALDDPNPRHDLGESTPVSEVTPENAHREPPAPVPTQPPTLCPPQLSGVSHRHPPRHTPPHPIGGIHFHWHGLRGHQNCSLPGGSDMAGPWPDTPRLSDFPFGNSAQKRATSPNPKVLATSAPFPSFSARFRFKTAPGFPFGN